MILSIQRNKVLDINQTLNQEIENDHNKKWAEVDSEC